MKKKFEVTVDGEYGFIHQYDYVEIENALRHDIDINWQLSAPDVTVTVKPMEDEE